MANTKQTPKTLRSTDPVWRIRRAIAEMPYGAALSALPDVPHGPDAVDPLALDDVATYLEALRDRLRGVAETQQQNSETLERHRAMFAGLRALAAEVLP